MTSLAKRSLEATFWLFVVTALLLFAPPWTLYWWQAWLFLAVYFGGSVALMVDLSNATRPCSNGA